jgi:hypothetical protein
VLGGGTAELPQLLPGPGQQLTKTPETKDPEIPALHFPFAGWRASPALGAMQELKPDFIWVYSKMDKNPYFLASQKIRPSQMVKIK